MEPITIIQNEKIIAHHTTDSSMSSYGQAVWIIEVEDPEPGHALWRQGDQEVEIIIQGVVGGWLITTQPDGFLTGIIWSDGNYYADLVEDRESGNGGKGLSIEDLQSGKYRIRGSITVDAWDEKSPLGNILYVI